MMQDYKARECQEFCNRYLRNLAHRGFLDPCVQSETFRWKIQIYH